MYMHEKLASELRKITNSVNAIKQVLGEIEENKKKVFLMQEFLHHYVITVWS